MRGIELTPEHPIDRIAALGSVAESAGFDTVFAACHYFNRDPFVTLDRIAAATDAVRVGPAAANPYETHPVVLASRLATLQEASGGRAVLGLGPGDRSALDSLGLARERPLRRVLETIEVARSLWAGDRVTHDGTFTAGDVGLEYPVERPVPVYVAAQGPGMLGMAGTHADGILFNGSHPRDLAWASERVAAARDDRADERGPLDLAAYASVSVAHEAAAAREAARPPVAFIAGGASQAVLDRHDLDRDVAATIGEALTAGEFTRAFETVTADMIDAFAIAGTPDQVVDGMAAAMEYVDSLVVGAPLGPDLETAVRLAGEALATAAGT